MIKQKGLTLVELLITMVIVSIIIGISYSTFNKVLTGSKSQIKSIESQIDKTLALENMRLDIEHAGFGIANDETEPPMSWNVTTQTLTLRSTMSNTNRTTQGWLMVDCSSGGNWTDNIVIDKRAVATNNIVFLSDNGTLIKTANSTNTTCPGNGLDALIGYTYDNSVTNGCTDQRCMAFTYTLSDSQPLPDCNSNTRNLLRKVGGSNGNPVLNCVADWDMIFDLDTNNDRVVDVSDSSSCNGTQVVRSKVYILFQEGRFDKDYNFSGNNTAGGFNIGAVNLTLPNDYQHYRWRIIQMTIKNMDI